MTGPRRAARCAARLVAACLLVAPAAAWADPISLIFIGAGLGFTGTAALVVGAISAYGSYAMIALNIFGGMDARRRARNAASNARRAYNASLTDRMATVLSADPPLRVVYGQCRVGGDIVAIFTSDKTSARTNGSTYTKPDALRHLVIVLAAHEVDDIVEMYIDGVAVGALDGNGWANTGGSAKPLTVFRDVAIGNGASVTFPAAITLVSMDDADGFLDVGQSGVDPTSGTGQWVGRATSHTVTGAGNNILNNNSGFAVTATVHYAVSPGTVRWSKALGTASQATDAYLLATIPSKWTSADRLRGLAYVTVTLDLEDQRFQGGPPALTFEVRGRKLFDPRDSGTRWTDNPALIVRDYLTAPWGLDCVAGDIDDAYTITAANACAAAINFSTVPDGGGSPVVVTGATYTCNGAVTSADGREGTLDALCESMGGFAVYGARWQVHAGAWSASVLALGDDDLAGQIDVVQAGTALDDAFNGLRGSYVPSGSSVVSNFSYANGAYVTADGRELWTDITLPFTNTGARARNLARVLTERNREAQVLRFPAKLAAWPLQVGDRVTVTSAEYGLTAKPYRVTDWQFGLTTPVMLTLQEDAPEIYDQADAATADALPNTGLPNSWSVAAVTSLAAASGDAHLQVLSDGSLNLRVRLTWVASASAYVADGSGQIEIKWRSPLPKLRSGTLYAGDAADQWQTVVVPGDATVAYIDGLARAEVLTISVTAINGLRMRSGAVALGHTVIGKTAPADNVAGFAGNISKGRVVWTWTPPNFADYGTTEVRATNANWGSTSSPPLFKGKATSWHEDVTAAGTYTRHARHIDTTGNDSAATASATVVVASGDLVTLGGLGYTGDLNATSARSISKSLDQWTLASQPMVVVSDGKVGTAALQLNGNAGAYPNATAYTPIDRTKKYRVRFWARPSADNASGLLYFSLQQFTNAAGTPGPSNDGRNPYQPGGQTRAQHNTQFGGTDQWGEYTYIWDAANWQTGVTHVRPEFLDNYNGAPGYWQIQDFTFEEITEVVAAAGTANWTGVANNDGNRPAPNATVGATWGSNITSQPANTALLNTLQEWSDVQNTGGNRPANNATVNRWTFASSAPGSPIDGDIWVDTSAAPAVIKLRVAAAWQSGANLSAGALAQLNSVATGQIDSNAATAVYNVSASGVGITGNTGTPTGDFTTIASYSWTPPFTCEVQITIEGSVICATPSSGSNGQFAVFSSRITANGTQIGPLRTRAIDQDVGFSKNITVSFSRAQRFTATGGVAYTVIVEGQQLTNIVTCTVNNCAMRIEEIRR
jgi:hypothetical protein